MMNRVIKRIAMLFMVCGLAINVSFGYDLSEVKKGEVEGVKEIVAELERVKKQTYNNYIGTDGEDALLDGKKFLEFVEKVKQSPKKDCDSAVIDVMSDVDNNDKYRIHNWSKAKTHLGCMNIGVFVDSVREAKKWLDNKGIKNNLPKL